ncbi:MAG: hypothetical protein P8173_09935, partial [Gammaproteobacteria bacterium]
PPLQGGEAEGVKGPVNLFRAERVQKSYCTPVGIGVGMGVSLSTRKASASTPSPSRPPLEGGGDDLPGAAEDYLWPGMNERCQVQHLGGAP